MRKEIVTKLIKSMPGISYNEIVRDTGFSNGVVSHYIIKLIDSGEIEKEGEKRGKYFTTNILKKDRILITVLRNKTNNEIFKYIMKQTNCNQVVGANKISKKIKKSGSTVSVSLKILQKNNILERVIMNKNSKLTNDIGYRVSNIEVWTKYFIKYNL